MISTHTSVHTTSQMLTSACRFNNFLTTSTWHFHEAKYSAVRPSCIQKIEKYEKVVLSCTSMVQYLLSTWSLPCLDSWCRTFLPKASSLSVCVPSQQQFPMVQSMGEPTRMHRIQRTVTAYYLYFWLKDVPFSLILIANISQINVLIHKLASITSVRL